MVIKNQWYLLPQGILTRLWEQSLCEVAFFKISFKILAFKILALSSEGLSQFGENIFEWVLFFSCYNENISNCYCNQYGRIQKGFGPIVALSLSRFRGSVSQNENTADVSCIINNTNNRSCLNYLAKCVSLWKTIKKERHNISILQNVTIILTVIFWISIFVEIQFCSTSPKWKRRSQIEARNSILWQWNFWAYIGQSHDHT